MPSRQDFAVLGSAQILERQHSDGRIARPVLAQVGLPHKQHRDRHEQHPDDREVGIAAQAVR